MKKALALVLALVLALSMAVSAFAADRLITLNPAGSAPADIEEIYVVDIDEESLILYTRPFMPAWDEDLTDSYVTYIALDPEKNYTDIVLTATGILDAELVKYDPETMDIEGALEDPLYEVTYKGKTATFDVSDMDIEDVVPFLAVGDEVTYVKTFTSGGQVEASVTLIESNIEALEAGKSLEEALLISGVTEVVSIDSCAAIEAANAYDYEDAVALAKALNDADRVGHYGVKALSNINVIKLTVENNFTRAFTKGTLKIEAKLGKKAVSNTLTVINDVTIFEYEEVKWAAKNNEDGAALQLGDGGYSDYFTSEYGYGKDYVEEELRDYPFALVVSTTAFRAIEGKDLTLDVLDTDAAAISVTLKEIVKGQKGVNFFAWADLKIDERTEEDEYDDNLVAASFGFMSEDVIKGEFEINVELGLDYYDLRELFGEKVEEEDIITYYVLKNGKAFDSFTVDYMTDDIDENVELTIKGENEKLGWYTLALEVPAEETETEENPNTGAESVVGVVAALAVVSVATAAAVSLKK